MSAFKIWSYWRAGRIRRAAVAEIKPFVERSRRRFGQRIDAAWRRPYVVGFMSMLISLSALSTSRGRMSDEELGLVQIDAWRELTRQPDDEIGEAIQLLSAERDANFMEGCRNAREFWGAYHAAQRAYGPTASGLLAGDINALGEFRTIDAAYFMNPGIDQCSETALWNLHFDDRL